MQRRTQMRVSQADWVAGSRSDDQWRQAESRVSWTASAASWRSATMTRVSPYRRLVSGMTTDRSKAASGSSSLTATLIVPNG
jgi:hypothetical protein